MDLIHILAGLFTSAIMIALYLGHTNGTLIW